MHNTIHTSLLIPLREPRGGLPSSRACFGLWLMGNSEGEEIGLLVEVMEEREAEGSRSEVKMVSCLEGERLFSW